MMMNVRGKDDIIAFGVPVFLPQAVGVISRRTRNHQIFL
jgi:hypothetical protein